MENLLDNLKNLLKKDERLISEGKLLKNKIIELALKLDKELIKLLLSDKKIKGVFFADVDGTLIFDKDKFIKFVSNKQFLPDSYTAFKNKIGLIDEKGEFISEKKEVVLSWPYKDCVLEGGMTKEDQKRDEIFWNEILAPDEISRLLDPKVFTNAKRIDKNGEHKFDGFRTDDKGDIKDNLIIKGNNLLVLHSLKKRFAGKVKLIYIDPPYYFRDTRGGDTFLYNSNFKLSAWLSFMKDRLQVAKELLANEGSIFIQINDEGSASLKLLLDEIFGADNFINVISVKMKNIAGASGGGEDIRLKKNIEFIYIFARNNRYFERFKNIYDYVELYDLINRYRENGISWKYTSVLMDPGKKQYICSTTDAEGNEIKIFECINPVFKSINQLQKEKSLSEKEVYYKYINNIFSTAMPQSSIRERVKKVIDKIEKKDASLFSIEYTPCSGRHKGQIYEQFYKGPELRLLSWLRDVSEEKDGKIFKKELQGTYWDGFNLNNLSKEGRVQLENGKKPEALLQRIIEMGSDKGDVILDFFAGTGTTCAVAHKMGRQYIGIEQLDYGENSAVVRLKNVINGDQTGISKSVGWKGGGDFVYLELMKWNENFVEKIQKAKTKDEAKKLWETMKEKAFLSYKVDIKAVDENAKDFADLSLEDQKRFLLECLDKNHLYVNYSEIDDEDYGVSEEDKKLNREFYEAYV